MTASGKDQDPALTGWPVSGTITIAWEISTIDAQRRLGWSFQSVPHLDPPLAIGLLRDVADELEIDLP